MFFFFINRSWTVWEAWTRRCDARWTRNVRRRRRAAAGAEAGAAAGRRRPRRCCWCDRARSRANCLTICAGAGRALPLRPAPARSATRRWQAALAARAARARSRVSGTAWPASSVTTCSRLGSMPCPSFHPVMVSSQYLFPRFQCV